MDNEVSFSIHVIGNRTGQTWTGEFKVQKFLSHRAMLQKDQLLRKYLSGENPQITAQLELAAALSTCQSSLTKAPDWWNNSDSGLDLVDTNVLTEVYSQIVRVQDEAEKAVKAKAEAAAQELSSKATKKSEKQ